MVEGINGILEGWLTVGVTTTHNEQFIHWMQDALYQGPRPNRATQACCTATRNCAAIVVGLCMSWIWTAICYQKCSMGFIYWLWDGQSMISTAWFCRESLVTRTVWGSCSGRGLSPRVSDFVASHVCALAGSWCCPTQPSHICHHSEIKPIWWVKDWHHHLFPAHKHQCAFHNAAYPPKITRLCDEIWILTRQWRYRGGCPKWCLADDALNSV